MEKKEFIDGYVYLRMFKYIKKNGIEIFLKNSEKKEELEKFLDDLNTEEFRQYIKTPEFNSLINTFNISKIDSYFNLCYKLIELGIDDIRFNHFPQRLFNEYWFGFSVLNNKLESSTRPYSNKELIYKSYKPKPSIRGYRFYDAIFTENPDWVMVASNTIEANGTKKSVSRMYLGSFEIDCDDLPSKDKIESISKPKSIILN